MTSHSIIILLFSILFCTVTAALAVMFWRSNRCKDLLLAEMRAAMTPVGREDEKRQTWGERSATHSDGTFHDNLRTAELTTRLQQPRLSAQQGIAAAATPERYRYLQSMVASGLSAQEIASTLSMSLPEVTQIIALIRVSNSQQQWAATPQPSTASTIPVPLTATTVDAQDLPRRQGGKRQDSAHKSTGAVNSSSKLARWCKRLRARTLPPCLCKQSGREPPASVQPPRQGISCHPLPGYT